MKAITLEDAMTEPLEELTEAISKLQNSLKNLKQRGARPPSGLLSWVNING